MERNVSNVAREAQGRVEPQPMDSHHLHHQHHQQQQHSHPQQQAAVSGKQKNKDNKSSSQDNNPSATSKFSRRWSFKKLSKMNSKKNSGNWFNTVNCIKPFVTSKQQTTIRSNSSSSLNSNNKPTQYNQTVVTLFVPQTRLLTFLFIWNTH